MMARYLMTHSLLSSWLHMLPDDYGEDPMGEFLRVLNREPSEPSKAALEGIAFEELVTGIMGGTESPEGHDAAARVAGMCRGGVLQYKAKKEIEVDGTGLLLYGRLDCLKAGEVIDIKHTRHYERGKYFASTQHPVYLELVPEAARFTYVVSNGTEVWTEVYRRDETRSPYPVISDFLKWLDAAGLLGTYREKWGTV